MTARPTGARSNPRPSGRGIDAMAFTAIAFALASLASLAVVAPGLAAALPIEAPLADHVPRGATRGFGVASSDQFGTGIASIDWNGDGYADLAVGAPFVDVGTGADNVGRVYVMMGGGVPDPVPDFTMRSSGAEDNFGLTIAAGDLNGDGFGDFVIGAKNASIGFLRSGAVRVYLGSVGPDTIPDLLLEPVDGYLFLGRQLVVCDVDGDGFDDIVAASQPSLSGQEDHLHLWRGRPVLTPVRDQDLALGTSFATWSLASLGNATGGPGDEIVAGEVSVVRVLGWIAGALRSHGTDIVRPPGEPSPSNFGDQVGAAGDVNGDAWSDFLVGASTSARAADRAGAAYLYLGGPTLDTQPDAVMLGRLANEQFGGTLAPAGDLDANGLDDFAIGAPASVAGSVTVFLSAPPGASRPSMVLAGISNGERFGATLAPVPDLDGDGFPELAIGAPLARRTNLITQAGRVDVVDLARPRLIDPIGGETWLPGERRAITVAARDPVDAWLSPDDGATWLPLVTGHAGDSVRAIGLDVPALEAPAARVRVSSTGRPVLRASSSEVPRAMRIVPPPRQPRVTVREPEWPGDLLPAGVGCLAAARAGDVDGDGAPDAALALDAGGAREVAILAGGAAVPSRWIARLPIPGPGRGPIALACGADLDGDGRPDVVAGAPGDPTDPTAIGRVALWRGGPAMDPAPALEIAGAPGERFGAALAVGDADGDGAADLAIGAPGATTATSSGRVVLLHGGPALDAMPDHALGPGRPGAQFGAAVAVTPDVDGDGAPELVVGSPRADALAPGEARIYERGSAHPFVTLAGESAGDGFGARIVAAGDLDRDGGQDLAIAAPFADRGAPDAGAVYVWRGAPRLAPSAERVFEGGAPSAWLGATLDAGGDVNGDGFPDLVAGAPLARGGGVERGAVRVLEGALRLDLARVTEWTGAVERGEFGAVAALAGDLDGDGFADLVAAGSAGAPSGASGTGPRIGLARRWVIEAPASFTRWPAGTRRTVAWRGAEPADVWLERTGDTAQVLARGAGGAESNAIEVVVPATPGQGLVALRPADASVTGMAAAGPIVVTRAVSLESFDAAADGGEILLSWSTEPGLGPEIAGYRLYRIAPGGVVPERIGPDPIVATALRVPERARGATYVLAAIHGFGEEAELGRVTLASAGATMRAWPTPLGGGALSIECAVPFDAAGRAPQDLALEIFDVSGRRIASLAGGGAATDLGLLRATWDRRDASGRPVRAGVYLLRLSVPSVGRSEVRRVVAIE
jgi:hypothetical protein